MQSIYGGTNEIMKMMIARSLVLADRRDAVSLLTLNDLARYNALDARLRGR